MPSLQLEDTFESGGLWAATSGTPTIVTSPVPVSSTRALQVNPAGAAEYAQYTGFTGSPTRVTVGFWLRRVSGPSATSRIAKIDFGPTECWLRMESSGQLSISGDGTPTMTAAFLSGNLAVGTWYWVNLLGEKANNPWEFHVKVGTNIASISGAEAASSFSGSHFPLLGPTTAVTYEVLFGHLKYGAASSDVDWWDEPTGLPPAVSGSKDLLLLGVG